MEMTIMFFHTVPVFSLVILIIASSTLQHFILPVSECILADLCNHTWVPVCGKQESKDGDVHTKLFSDDCHRHEHNCDNKKEFLNVEFSECEQLTSTTEATLRTIDTKTANANCSRHLVTNNSSPDNITTPMTTKIPTTETIITNIETDVDETDKSKTSDIHNTVNIETTQEIATTEHRSKDTTKIMEAIANAQTTTDLTTVIETTILEKANSKLIEITTAPDATNCRFNEMYRKDCMRPFTWETTMKGETRDFYRILRERFGTKV